jgi:hypothetical protein
MDFRKTSISMQIHLVGAELFHADRQKVSGAFAIFRTHLKLVASTLKTEAVFFETLVIACSTTRRQIPEDSKRKATTVTM